MAFFDCIVGGSGKGNTVTVTCAEEFAGLTITLSKTGKTYTKTCPSTAPYTVTYYGVENGTYTVSCTVGGQTYSETVVVQDISCVLNYGFTWRTWVDTASQLDSSDYDSLDEVLADEKALRELFLEHACVDYMAEATSSNANLETIINDDYCAKWINNSDYALDFLGANTVIKALMDAADKYGYGEWVITDDSTTPPTWGPKGNVPVMTSTSAPYGASSMSVSPASGYESYKIFDRNPQTRADTGGPALSGARIYYKFTNPTNVRRAYWAVQTSGGVTRNVKWQYSDDGTTWTDAKSESIVQTAGYFKHYTDIPDCGYHLYWAYYLVSSSTTTTSFGNELQFYGRELKVSVPTMTSNTAPFGEAISNSPTINSTYFYNAFDKNASTRVFQEQNTTHYIGYDFKNKNISIRKFSYYLPNDTSYTYKLMVQNSDDGITWNDYSNEFTYTSSNWSSEAAGTKFYDVDGNDTSRYWRIKITASSNFGAHTNSLQFYGLDYSEKEFEEGTTKKWLYDHGVELAGITAYKANASNTAEKENNQLYLKGAVASSIYGFRTASKIDLTAYSLIRTKVGNKGGTASRLYYMGVVNVITDAHSSAVAEGEANITNAPNNESLSISSVNGSYYPVLRETDGNSSSSGSISEWWLE